IAANRHDIDCWIGEKVIEFIVNRDRAAMFGAQFCRVEIARRANGRDLRQRHCVNCRYMTAGRPPVTDNADVVFLHRTAAFDGTSFRQGCQAMNSVPLTCQKCQGHSTTIRSLLSLPSPPKEEREKFL